MRSYLNAHPTILRAKAREIIGRILAGPDKDVSRAKLGDVRLVIADARAGRVAMIAASWDDDQRELAEVLADYHNLSIGL